ncbi:methyltransferase, TIGR04325 family [Pseudanabaena mucicola]|uniref:Methyltransferase, TIGR04325 family n=1 Tax=Pseudanabaena mucicola FACHB-723 TaxID=2692860 RepID=A0ABR7ZT33_9CYAN|nr:methyltransferase, TIGR04325 family [Pseudanabaena mucicola]MBD2187106.1 methyltransferase, TIGR04325 family [Pseudanabaena mucicola FACHB-723]
MMSYFKQFIRDWLPPAITHFIQNLRHQPRNHGAITFEGDYQTWEKAQADSSGYNQAEILEKVKNATLKVKHGQAVYERDSVLFDQIEYAWPVLAGLMWVAAQNNGKLHVLDFGGSLGSSYFQNRQFLSNLTEVTWSVVEQSHFVECGREFIADDCLQFYLTIDECLEKRSPNVILLSGVLQYLENPFLILHKLGSTKANFLIIDRTPFSIENRNYLLIQQVYPEIYRASYPIWIFAVSKFEKYLSSSWFLLSKFNNSEGNVLSSQGLSFFFQGLIYKRNDYAKN